VAKLVWTPPALRDIQRLHGFLAPKNPDAARRAVRAIRQGVKALAAHPEAGRPVDDLPLEFREWQIPFGADGYIALYRYGGGVVAMLAVRHGREAGY
jgi:plasmid stabilization system protein ParE